MISTAQARLYGLTCFGRFDLGACVQGELDGALPRRRSLPETRDTLPLRLMGAGAARERALEELKALQRKDWERQVFIPLLLAFRILRPQDLEEPDEEIMRYAEQMRALYTDWERQVREETLRKGLVKLYQARFRSGLPAALQVAIEATDDEPTLSDWLVLFGTGTPDEIAAAVLAGNASSQP